MGRTARRDALLVPYDGEISKYSGVMLRRNTLSDTGFHGVRKIDVKGGVKFQAVVFDRVRKKLKACGTFRGIPHSGRSSRSRSPRGAAPRSKHIFR